MTFLCTAMREITKIRLREVNFLIFYSLNFIQYLVIFIHDCTNDTNQIFELRTAYFTQVGSRKFFFFSLLGIWPRK